MIDIHRLSTIIDYRLPSMNRRSMKGTATSPISRKHAAARWIRLIVGLWLFAAGLALMVRADLGLSSWDVFHDAIAAISVLSFGGAIVVASVVVVVVSAVLGIKPGPGTIANMVLVGIFTDALLTTELLRGLHASGVIERIVALNAGIAAIAFGTGLYIGAGLGAGPRDSLMLALSKRLRTTPGKARTALELAVLIVGVVLGGTAGWGTLAFALLIGPAIDVCFALLGMSGNPSRRPAAKRADHGAMTWVRKGQLASARDKLARHSGDRQ
jgi:uncharacterized protein